MDRHCGALAAFSGTRQSVRTGHPGGTCITALADGGVDLAYPARACRQGRKILRGPAASTLAKSRPEHRHFGRGKPPGCLPVKRSVWAELLADPDHAAGFQYLLPGHALL